MQSTLSLAYKTGDPVTTPLGEVGYVTEITEDGVFVRLPRKGADDHRCITPKASLDSLWIFPHQSINKAQSCVL